MSQYFRCLIQELHHNKPQFRHLTNIPNKNVRQSSVAIIFRVNKPQSEFEIYRKEIEAFYSQDPLKANFDCMASLELLDRVLERVSDSDLYILLTERAYSPRDINSGFIVFPGGKCEEEETDLTACLRETKEQVGLRLIDQAKGPFASYLNCYLGKSLNNLFYQQYKGTDLYVTAHVFLLLHDKPVLVLNAEEVCQSQWIPFTQMFNPNKISRQIGRNQSAVNHAIPNLLSSRRKSICKQIERTQYSVLDVGFQRMKLWGCTLYIWLYVCRMMQYRATQDNLPQSPDLSKFLSMADVYKVKFKTNYLPGILFQKNAQRWHYKNRSLASQYPQSNGWLKLKSKHIGFGLMFALCSYYFI